MVSHLDSDLVPLNQVTNCEGNLTDLMLMLQVHEKKKKKPHCIPITMQA